MELNLDKSLDLSLALAEVLATSKAKLSTTQVALLSPELSDVCTHFLRAAIKRQLADALKNIELVDPATGLPVSPLAREFYQSRDRKSRRLSAPDFLKQTWGDYLEPHLLYSGHLRKIDLSLYNALTYHARSALCSVSSSSKTIPESELAAVFFENYGVLASWHLKHPIPGTEQQVDLIQRANRHQSKPLGIRAKPFFDEMTPRY